MLRTQYEEYKKMIEAGMHLFPVRKDKTPATGCSWNQNFSKEKRLEWLESEPWGFGLECGSEWYVIDIDHDAETLLPEIKKKLDEKFPDVWSDFFVESTPHGAHLILHTNWVYGGNKKLVWRYGDPEKWDAKHDRYEREGEIIVQIETRGQGGYIIPSPAEGYKVHELSAHEHLYNLPLCKSDTVMHLRMVISDLNSGKVKVRPARSANYTAQANVRDQVRKERKAEHFICNPFITYGEAFTKKDWEDLLKSYGWVKMREDSEGRIFYQRPGKAAWETDHSANLREVNGCWLLYVYTTNAGLPVEEGLPAWKFMLCTEFEIDYINSGDMREWAELQYEAEVDQYKPQWGALAEYLNNL